MSESPLLNTTGQSITLASNGRTEKDAAPARYRLWPDLLTLAVMGLTPLLWLTPGTIVTGGDANFPLDPIEWFLGRSFVWNDLFNCGIPAAINATSLFFHGLQALFTILGLTLFHTQQAFYVFWFTAVCASMYYFMAVVQGDKPDRLQRFTAVIFYAYNPLLFNVWEATKAAELSALVGMPILFAWLILGVERRLPRWVLGCRAVLLAIVVCEIGAGPPVLVAAALLPLGFIVALVLRACATRRWGAARWNVGVLLIVGGAFLAASMFWALPYGMEIYHQVISNPRGDLGAFNLTDWLRGISTHTSVLNVSRLQGAWDWYYTWNEEPYIAYAARYRDSLLLVLLSFGFPILAYSAMLARPGFLTIFLAGITFVMTILSSGAHPPFGTIYLFVSERVPFMSMFRSPYYKFGLLVTFGYAVLMAIAVRAWTERLRTMTATHRVFQRPPWRILGPQSWGVLLIGCNLVYAHPLLTGEIVYMHQKLPSIKITVPPYIVSAARWLSSSAEEGRILSLPKESIDIYHWGYASIVHALNLASRRAVLSSRDFVAGFESANLIREDAYRGLYDRITPWVGKILGLLHCKYLLVREDSWYDFYGNTDSPAFVKRQLWWQEGIRFAKRFGAWVFYAVDAIPPKLYGVAQATLVKGGIEGLSAWAARDDVTRPAWVFPEDVTIPQLQRLVEERRVGAVAFHQSGWEDLILDLAGPEASRPFPENAREIEVAIPREGLHELWGRLLPSLRPEDVLDISLTVNHRRVVTPSSSTEVPARGVVAASWYPLGRVYLVAGSHRVGMAADNRRLSHLAVIHAEEAARYRGILRSVLEDPAVDVALTVTTKRMQAVVQPPPPGYPARVRALRHFHRSSPWMEDGQPWRWVRGGGPHLVIKNHAKRTSRANLGLTVYSPAADRALYLLINGQLLDHPVIPWTSPRRMVFRQIELRPGANQASLSCPQEGIRTQEPGEPPGTRAYALGFQDLVVGPVRFWTQLQIPRRGIYQIRLMPYPVSHAFQRRITDAMARQPDVATVTCNERPVPVQWSSPTARGYRWLEGRLELAEGPCLLTVRQWGEEDYLVELRSVGTAPPTSPIPIRFHQVTPTKFEVEWPGEQGGFLVFLNAFHPHWVVGALPADALSEDRVQPTIWTRYLPSWSLLHAWPLLRHAEILGGQHLNINGYANAWYVEPEDLAAPRRLVVAYAPQLWFELGIVITGVAVLCAGLGLIIWGWRSSRRKVPVLR